MKFFSKIALIIFILQGCGTSNRMSPIEYLSWYDSPNNLLQFTDSVRHDFTVSLKELSPEFMASNCIKFDCLPKDSIRKILNEKQTSIEYQLKYILPEKNMFTYNYQSEIHGSQRMQYYSFDFKDDIRLITVNNDTVKCTYLLFERGLPDSPYGIFEFSFPFIENKKISKIEISNRALSTDTTVFNIDHRHTNLPKLKI